MHAGLQGDDEALDAARVTLRALGARIDANARAAIEQVLPAALRSELHAQAQAEPSLQALAASVGAERKVALGPALEQAEAVCRAIALELDDDAQQRLQRRIAEEFAPLFARPREEHAPTHPAHIHRRSDQTPRSLARGKPGSRHPLSEAAPDRAQSGSIAHWDGSRDDRTLGGYRADAEQRADETPPAAVPDEQGTPKPD